MPTLIQRSFTAGVLAPAVRARADLDKYSAGLAGCWNMLVRSQGGVYNRPGTRFVCELSDSSRVGRLVEFTFNADQTYILLFEHNKIRFIVDGGVIESGGSPYEVVTTYTEDQLPRLQFVQDADVMTIVHPDHDPARLIRITDINWTLTTNSYISTITRPAISSLTAIGSGAGSNNKTYRYQVTQVNSDGEESLPSATSIITTPSLGVTAGVSVAWTNLAGADHYRIYKSESGSSGVFGFIGEANSTPFEDFNVAPLTSDTPPTDRDPFAGAGNKPSVVGNHQQRDIYANTNNEPQTLFMSQVGFPLSMRVSRPTRDDDAITFRIKARQANEIRHLLSLDGLIVLTAGAEYVVTEGADLVLTPTTVGAQSQSFNGANWVPPVIINSTALYVQEKGARIRDLSFEFVDDKFTGNDLSIMAEHLFENREITDMAFAQEPYGILWCIRDDGRLLGLTYQRTHKVFAWHEHATGASGTFESVAVIKEGNRDAPYFIVKRTINGSTVRYVERMEPRVADPNAVQDSFYVDSGLSYEGTPVTVLSGLDHLEGETVAVLADGDVVEGLSVSSGSITLPTAASTVHVGLGYEAYIDTLELDVENSTRGKTSSLSKVQLDVEATRGGHVKPILEDGSFGDEYEIKPRFVSDGYDTIPLRTFKQEVFIEPGWPKTGAMRISQQYPLPMAILAVIPDVEIGGS